MKKNVSLLNNKILKFKQFIFYSIAKDLKTQNFITKNTTDLSELTSFSFSINNTYALYEKNFLAWIPKTQNLYDDSLEYLSNTPISYPNLGFNKIKKIICNNNVCFAITESLITFSWGNDIEKKGLLGLGENIFHIKNPKLNKYLSSLKVDFISLSENHGACLDIKGNLYTWGDDTFGQCGINEDNKNNICYIPKKVNVNSDFYVNKVECGKFYTAGITKDGIPFKFGVINNNGFKNENEKIGDIKFFNIIKNDVNTQNNIYYPDVKYDKINDIFSGEELLIFISIKGNMYIYSELQGLFKVKLNPYENNIRYSSLFNEDKLNYYINSVKFIDRTFYAISKNNSIIYEFINYTYKNKPLNLFDYVQNEYEVNENVELSFINQPYYVKAIFFKMNCLSYDINDIENGNISIFKKRKIKSYNINLNYSNTDNKCITSNQNLFSNRRKNDNSFMNSNNSINRVSRISSMLGNIFDMKINNYVNKTKLLQNSEGNAFLLGKKRIELIRMDYINSEGVNLLANEAMNDYYLDTNAFNMANNILNIPINENYYNDRNKSIVFDEERKDDDDFSNRKLNFDKESPINYNNGYNNNILPFDNFENNENNKLRANSSNNHKNNEINENNKLNDNDTYDNNNKLRGRSSGNYINNEKNENNNNLNDDNSKSKEEGLNEGGLRIEDLDILENNKNGDNNIENLNKKNKRYENGINKIDYENNNKNNIDKNNENNNKYKIDKNNENNNKYKIE